MSLAARFEKLSPREQRLLQALGALLGGLFLLGAPYSLYSSVAEVRSRNEDIRALLERFESSKDAIAQRKEAAMQRDLLYGKPPIALASFIESAARSQGIEVPESSDQPAVTTKGFVEHSTQVKFRKVGLRALVNALEQLERSGNPVAVTSLHVTSRSVPDEYDVTLTVASYERKKSEPKKKDGADEKAKEESP